MKWNDANGTDVDAYPEDAFRGGVYEPARRCTESSRGPRLPLTDPPAGRRVHIMNNTTLATAVAERLWSGQQDAIFTFFVDANGHLIVRARAGTGKTTTIVEAVKRYLKAHPGKRVVVCAFNKRIADELTGRFAGYEVDVKTLHALGFMAVRRYWSGVRIGQGNDRKDDLTNRVCGQRVPDAIKKLVSKLHTLAREINPLAERGEQLIGLAENFECVPDEEWAAEGWTVDRVADYAVRAMALAASEKPVKTGIDFADMIFLPVRNGWLFGAYDMVVVDEAQDMTVAQLAIARGIAKPATGRVMVVGDDRQAIYGFRGADSGSLDRLKAELNATELGLTVTYRCGREIVREAALLVPDFTAGPANPEGEILGLQTDRLVREASAGDFILSRTNAPLVQTAMSLLRNGKRTKIAGRDIGAGLKTLVRKITRTARSVPEFLERLEGWANREVQRAAKMKNPEAKIDAVIDMKEMLANLADDAKNIAEIEARIDALFTDDGLGQAGVITCSSVHRAKGLEAERVFILADTLKAGGQEEDNIKYVAVTRAKQTLVWVAEQAPKGSLDEQRQKVAA